MTGAIEMGKKLTYYVDPPSGWKYGFPMVWDRESEPDMRAWLVQNGYPQKEIDRLGDHFYVRCWNADETT